MSTEQKENLDAILRQSAFPADIDVSELRRLLRELTSAQPLPADVTVTAAALGGVPTAGITVAGIEPRHVVLYFHGGVYVLGDAFPATGESAGDGLAIATLVNARDHGLPLPAAAFVMSPYADLTLAGAAMDTKHAADPLLSRDNLQLRVPDYTAGHDPALGLISPVFADLSGLPPLIIQAGTHEVLLDDAVRLARRPGPSRTAPVGAPRQRRTRHRIAKGRTRYPHSRTGRGLKSRHR